MSNKLNIHQRLNAVMKKVDYVQKDKPSGMKYSIVSHDSVTAKVRPELVKNGIHYYPYNLRYEQQGNRTQVQLDLRFVNIDDKEDYIDVACLGFGCDNQDKGPGKAVSYAVKYGLLKALGLKTGDDADLDNIDHKEKEESEEKSKDEDKQPFKPKDGEYHELAITVIPDRIESPEWLKDFIVDEIGLAKNDPDRNAFDVYKASTYAAPKGCKRIAAPVLLKQLSPEVYAQMRMEVGKLFPSEDA